jgi:chromosome segregation ATPase
MLPRLKEGEVRSGFLGTVDAAIKYFDPNQYTPTASAKERLDKENETAKLEAERLRKELEEMRQELSESEFNRRQVESDYAFVEEKISKHAKEKSELQKELYALQEQLQAKDFELKEALDQLALLKRDIVNAEVANKRVDGHMSSTGTNFFPTKSRDYLMRAMESTEIEHEKAIAKLSELQQELQIKKATIEGLNLRLTDEANERKRIVSHTKLLLDERLQRLGAARPTTSGSKAGSKAGSKPGSKSGSKPPSNA